MGKAEHRPGPWRAEGCKVTAGGYPVALTFSASWLNAGHNVLADGQIEANARLISAAPELLGALKAANGWLQREACESELGIWIDAAIAKAEAQE